MTNLIKSEKVARVVETVAAIPRTLIHSVDVTTISTQSLTGNVPAEITGLSVTLTPQSVNSKFLLMANWNGESYPEVNFNAVFGFKRDNDYIGNPEAGGGRAVGRGVIAQGYYNQDRNTTPDSWSGQFVDIPNTTDEITYKVFITSAHTQTLYNNRTVADDNVTSCERLTSSLIILEIA